MRRHIIRYNSALKERAGELRRNSTLSEVLLWKRLKGKQMRGYDFHRQKPVGNYIVDFYCSELFLAIEIDGSTMTGETTRMQSDRSLWKFVASAFSVSMTIW